MDAEQHNLLTEPLIRVQIGGSVRRLSLPDLFAAMMADQVEGFPALRPHQRHALHMLLAQIGALALLGAGLTEPPPSAETWREALRALTPAHGDAPWCLVVEDVTRPAFLQPPSPRGGIAEFRNTVPTPDALDVLITARNFDLKSAIMRDSEPDDWLFALISLQTMEGFLGAGNFGIARMNGGFSSRPFLGLAPPGGIGAHLRRDIRAMLASREALLERYIQYPEEGGIALVWLAPWGGTQSLSIDTLDPWFVEICRRVRLTDDGGRLMARSVGTAAPRIAAKALSGVTGDFWAPVNKAENKGFSLDARGFSVRVLTQLLFGENGRLDFDWPPALTRQPDEGGMNLVARGIARGQGKTEGWHERILPFSGEMLAFMSSEERRREAGRVADLQLQETRQVAKALGAGCAVVAANGGEPSKDDYGAAEPYQRRLDAVMEAGFFAALEDRLTKGEAAKARYLRKLIDAAKALMGEAAATIPCASIHRFRAHDHAMRAFKATLWHGKGALAGDRDLLMSKEAGHAA